MQKGFVCYDPSAWQPYMVLFFPSCRNKMDTFSSRTSERSQKAKAEPLRLEVELKNLLKRQEMEHQMERQSAEMKLQEEELKRRIAILVAKG